MMSIIFQNVRASGVSKKDQQPYDFTTFSCLRPINFRRGNSVRLGFEAVSDVLIPSEIHTLLLSHTLPVIANFELVYNGLRSGDNRVSPRFRCDLINDVSSIL